MSIKEKIALGTSEASAKTEKTLPEDLLARDEFVDLAFQVAEKFSDWKKTACYAINGPWGAGKTYVLDRLAEKLRESGRETGENRFLVLRYNCWEYDYYDEPLLSIVATLLDGLEEYQLSEKTKATIKGILTVAGNLLINAAISYVDGKTNGAASNIVGVIDATGDVKSDILKKTSEFNDKLPFQKAIKLMREQISLLSTGEEGHTMIILVDELDRCLPEYAIRVLERLHHLFEGIENVQLVFSVDRKQLEHVVRQLYGPDADVKAYLKKFISFELKLGLGSLRKDDEARFDRRFASYVEQFRSTGDAEREAVAEFKAQILEGFDIRQRIALVEKAELVHSLTCGEETHGSEYLCMELFLTVFDAALAQLRREEGAEQKYRKQADFSFDANEVPFPNMLCFNRLEEIYKENDQNGTKIHSMTRGNVFNYCSDGVYGSVLLALRTALGHRDDHIYGPQKEFIEDFWEMLQHLE